MLTRISLVVFIVASIGLGQEKDQPIKGWKKGVGWGWIWGKDDEVGSLNAMTDASRLAALASVKQGKVYDLGLLYDRNSYKFPGHNSGEIMSYRSPEGVKRERSRAGNDPEGGFGWHSCALFISDNVGTQIDSLAHVTTGKDNHWYNGFTEAQWGGDFGLAKCDATTIPPIITRGVLIDVAGLKNVDALPKNYAITPEDLQAALQRQGTTLRPGDTILVRTGTMRYWGKTGSDHEKIAQHDSAGLNLAAAQWLIEQQGAIFIATDTSGLEVSPPTPGSRISVHEYMLIEQGVHIGEFFYLEDLAREKVYTFCFITLTNKIQGTAAAFTLRPIAIH